MGLSYKEVAEILKIVDASNCEEVVLELEGARLVIRKGQGLGSESEISKPDTVEAASSKVLAKQDTKQEKIAPAPIKSDEVSKSDVMIRSPMVGTFYRAQSPNEPPFVDIGSKVNSGDPLCLIEVMKLYTTIESTLNGTITAIPAEDGTLVEFDQPLFSIKTES